MKSVYFCNDGVLDLGAVEMMGVSVKPDSAIGYFGTGLKFAISTILRNGGAVTLETGGGKYEFTARPELVRGVEFQRIYMNDTALGFTTMLGRDWKMWQAYRELHSNCLDETGLITDTRPARAYDTTITVSCDEFYTQYSRRDEIFIATPPICSTAMLEIHKGGGHRMYGKGVLVHESERHCLFTYNLHNNFTLTEDRTLASPDYIRFRVGRDIAANVSDRNILRDILLAGDMTFEGSFNFSGDPLSDAFMDVVQENINHGRMNRSAVHRMQEIRGHDRGGQVVLDDYHRAMFDRAKSLLDLVGCPIGIYDFTVYQTLGPSVYGKVEHGRILLALKTFDMGPQFLASTLYEEWLHKTEGLQDESRELQNLLFEKLFAFVDRVAAIKSAA